MAAIWRRLLSETSLNINRCSLPCKEFFEKQGRCSSPCLSGCHTLCNSPPNQSTRSLRIPRILIVLACVFGFAFLLVSYYIIIFKYFSNRNTLRRRNPPITDDTEEFLDENHGPLTEVDHPIWFINTVGLQRAVIESITLCKYKKNEGLIDGTDCSVCLNEFEEDESVRLLPKCSHAFHLPCIDTWLRSHKNCPLCRAPILCQTIAPHASTPDQNSGYSSLPESTRFVNLDGDDGLDENLVRNGAPDEIIGLGDNKRIEKILQNRLGNPGFRVLSDLGKNCRVMEEVEPPRRSVSLDLSSVSKICLERGGSSSSANKLAQSEELNSGVLLKRSHSGSGVRRNSNIYRFMRSSSIGYNSLQKKGPICMKRSYSSSGRFFLSGHRRREKSVLPL